MVVSRERTVLRFVAVAMALVGVLLLAVATGAAYAEAASETGHGADFFTFIGTLLLIVLVVALFFGLLTGWIGSLRGRSFVNWFCLGLYLTILALIAVVVLPADRRDDAQ